MQHICAIHSEGEINIHVLQTISTNFVGSDLLEAYWMLEHALMP